MESMSQFVEDDDVCEPGAFGFAWQDVGRGGICLLLGTHRAAEGEGRIVTNKNSSNEEAVKVKYIKHIEHLSLCCTISSHHLLRQI